MTPLEKAQFAYTGKFQQFAADHMTALEAACQEYAKAIEAQGWRLIPDSDEDGKAPFHGLDVMVSDGSIVGEARYYHEEGGFWWAGSSPSDYVDRRVDMPTYWQPLPAPPTSGR